MKTGHPLERILQDYENNKDRFWRSELQYYKCLPNLSMPLEEAGLFHKDAMHRGNHQRRILKTSRDFFAKALCSDKIKTCIEKSENFEVLYKIVDELRGLGIGELTVYDTTMRLGAFLEKQKRKRFRPLGVYLHNGALDGAKKLLSRGLIQGPLSSVVSIDVFSDIFPGLETWEIEEVLCLYKHNF